MIYKIQYINNSCMNDIKTKLKNEIDRRWDCLDEYDKYEIIQKWYPTEYAEFYIFDKDDKSIDPQLITYNGAFRLVQYIRIMMFI